MKKIILIALGGNALLRSGEKGTISEQESSAEKACSYLLPLIEQDYGIIITHGNGPQVGNIVLAHEMAASFIPQLPLDVYVADSEGRIGYFMQQALLNLLRSHHVDKYVVTMITQVLVDHTDPAFKNPTKPIGPFYTRDEARKMEKEKGWKIVEQKGKGWRRTVPSPKPVKVIQRHMIRDLVKGGHIVIAAGGGGIPIWKKPDGKYEGIEAVVDKDLASSVLAVHIPADVFVILTEESQVALNYKQPDEKKLLKLSVGEASKYLEEGHFPPGSMGPKIEAALAYLKEVDKKVIITSPESLMNAFDGKDGTTIRR